MTATIIGNKANIYIDPITNNAFIDPQDTTNHEKIDFTGVNHLVIRRNDAGEMVIIQASGYTPEKGLFTILF